MRRFASALIFLVSFFSPLFVYAQTATGDSFDIKIYPTYPRPYDVVNIAPNSTLINMSASTVTLSSSGKVIAKGTGTQRYDVQLGGPGSANSITVTVAGPSGTFSKNLTIRPSDVSLIAEPATTVHPLYQGSPLVGSQSSVHLIALADLRLASGRIDPNTLVYNWMLGTQQLQPQSGIGKSTLTVVAPIRYRDATVSVVVTNQAGNVVGKASLTLTPANPLVRIYENDPLSGPRYEKALSDTFTMKDTESSFLAVPYFFSKSPAIAWTIGGNAAAQGPVVTVQSSGRGSGVASIQAKIAGSSLLEQGVAALQVAFTGTKSGGGIFGL
jgi:hypothetical protein